MPRSHSLLLVDGSNLAWRAASGFPARIHSRSGVDITAVFGFFALLRKTHRELTAGAEILVCFDGDENVPNPRITALPTYKQRNRVAPAFTPYEWLTTIQQGLDLLSIAHTSAKTYEADDDIATACTRFAGRITIMSSDADFLQLVDRRVSMLAPRRRYLVGDVLDRFGVHPRQWCDFRALVGDPSDNIAGVPGVGSKRAAAILQRNRSLETVRIPPTWWGQRVTEHRDELLVWRDIIRLRRDQEHSWQPLRQATPELPRASEICEHLGLWA